LEKTISFVVKRNKPILEKTISFVVKRNKNKEYICFCCENKENNLLSLKGSNIENASEFAENPGKQFFESFSPSEEEILR